MQAQRGATEGRSERAAFPINHIITVSSWPAPGGSFQPEDHTHDRDLDASLELNYPRTTAGERWSQEKEVRFNARVHRLGGLRIAAAEEA